MMKKYLFIGAASLAIMVFTGAGCSRYDATQGEQPNLTQEAPGAIETSPIDIGVTVPTPTGAEESVAEAEDVIEITMLAKKWEFMPKTLTVKNGQKVRLSISSVDVDHGFALPAFNVDTRLTAGQNTIVEFTATTAGTFPFTCTVYCGAGHGGMAGEVVVTE